MGIICSCIMCWLREDQTAAVESTCPCIQFSSTVHQQAVCMCPQELCVSVGHHYTLFRQHSFTMYQQVVFVCYTYMFPSAASFGNYGRDSVLFFTFSNVSRIFGKRAAVAYLHVLSLSYQSRRVITVYEFPLVFHASVQPRHSRYSSGAAYRGKVLTHT